MHASSSNIAMSGHRAGHSQASDFILPDEIPIDKVHTLDQLTSRFRNVRDGLPELVKNSKDQYARLGIDERPKRQILVIANTEGRQLAVLDFAGARAADFAGWTTWSSREAGRIDLSADIEAGHGNGGKAFMVRGANAAAFMESCFEGKRTRMGFRNEKPEDRYKPGFGREGTVTLDNVGELNPRQRLERFLSPLGLSIAKLPSPAIAAFEQRNAFTGVILSDVTEWAGRQKRTVKKLAEEGIVSVLAAHGQTALTIETCEVRVIVDGTCITDTPIAPAVLNPYPGFEHPLHFQIPDILPDPETGDSVAMSNGTSPAGYLELCTSERQLQMSEETKARNVIRLWNERNNVANWPLHALGVQITSVSFIYGKIRCPALAGEHLAGSDRIHLNDTPLARALEDWARQHVQKLAEDLHRAMMAENRPRDREQAKSALQSIRELMRRYLDADTGGEQDDDDNRGGVSGTNGGGYTRRRVAPEYGQRVDRITLEPGRTTMVLALGTTVPLRAKCDEVNADGKTKPVKAKNLRLCSSQTGFVTMDGEERIAAVAEDLGEIWLESEDGTVQSNRILCEVITATDVHIAAPEEPLRQGQRIKIPITFHTVGGPREDVLIDGTIDEPAMGLLGRTGRFTAGSKEGQATIRVRFGAVAQAQRTAVIHIGPERISANAQGGTGSDIPEILLCGDKVPGMEEYPEEQRTLAGGEELPTIIEDPLFQNVVWINPTSKEAMRVRRGQGSTGVGRISNKQFMQFLTLKCFDVLKRLHVRQALKGQSVTEYSFVQAMAYAEIECADFIDAAWDLSEQMVTRADGNGVQ